MWPTAAPWVLGTFTEKTESENGISAKQQYCFDAANGFLKRVRTLAQGTSPGANDLLVVFSGSQPACSPSAEGVGNVECEDYYGGDSQSLSTSSDLCGMSLPGGGNQYRILHTYSAGSLATTKYDGMTYFSTNNVINAATGLVKTSTDTAGLTTDYTYDQLGRITSATPQSGSDALTVYHYTKARWEAPTPTTAHVDIEVKPNGGGNDLTASRIVIDDFGRVGRRRRYLGSGNPLTIDESWEEATDLLPANQNDWSSVDYVYNALGWLTKTSVAYGPDVPLNWTIRSNFDAFGRPGTVTAPDGSAITLGYTGDRKTTRTVKIGTSYNPTTREIGQSFSTTKEIYDRQGRLYQVTEPSGAGGANVTTTYSYDVGGRLHQVFTGSGGQSQTRTFTYDNRGFLLSEQHPEKGALGNGSVLYSGYDARGHAGRKQDGPANGDFDLLYTYDRGERLTKVRETRLTGVDHRVLKEFTYGTSNSAADRSNGKLKTASRHNWVEYPHGSTSVIDAIVAETYTYGGRGGRVSQRTTTDPGHSFNQSWTYNELGEVATTGYPSCTFSPCNSQVPAPGRTVSFFYTKGLLTSVPGYADTIDYYSNTMLHQIQHDNHVTYTLGMDPSGMKRIAYIKLEGQHLTATPYLDYYYDGAGNVVRIEDEDYPRDLVGRVTAGDFITGEHQGYTYDFFGNMTSKATTRPGEGTTTQTFTMVGSTNHISGVGYDDAGDQTSWGPYAYGYDAFNMMQTYTGGGIDKLFLYTADDERYWTLDYSLDPDHPQETFTLRDLDGQVLRQYRTANGTPGPWQWAEDYVYRDGKLLSAAVPGEPGPRQFHLDHLGTPRLATDSNGGGLGLHTYFPFGEELIPHDDPEQMRFTGHQRDISFPGTADDLDYMHARYGSPPTGRFMSFDPVGGNPRVPQSWNRYAYALNNPLSFTDPLGLLYRGQTAGSAFTDQTTVCVNAETGQPCPTRDPMSEQWIWDSAHRSRTSPSPERSGCDFGCQVMGQVAQTTRPIAGITEGVSILATNLFLATVAPELLVAEGVAVEVGVESVSEGASAAEEGTSTMRIN